MKSKSLFIVVFVSGVILGMKAQPSPSNNNQASKWSETEETILKRMAMLQDRWDHLPTPDSVDALSKQIEAQVGIENILITYRQSQQAKYGQFVPSAATLIVGLLGVVGTFWGKALKALREALTTVEAGKL